MNIDVYAEPFAASGRYYDYGELLRRRAAASVCSTARRARRSSSTPTAASTVTADGSTFTLRNRDFNTLSFRSNVVLRWEWRPGSTLYVVWQQNRSPAAKSSVTTSASATCSDR